MDKSPEELAAKAQAHDEANAAVAAKLGARRVKARVLVACSHGQPNDVVLLDAAAAKNDEAEGQLDASKAAVAYAESLLGRG